MGEHTPGPWRFDGDWRRIPAIIGADGIQVAAIEKKKDGPRGFVADFPEREANARLIAAAPSLLATLEEAPEPPENFSTLPPARMLDWGIAYRKWWEHRRAAVIARVEGRAR